MIGVELLLSAAVSGLALGLLYGLLGFAVVLLYKSTGVANFAQGGMATMGAFVAFTLLTDVGLPLPAALGLGAVIAAALGAAMFVVVMRPRVEAGSMNLTVRTLGLSLLLLALMEAQWGQGAPYRFPSVVAGPGLAVGSVNVPAQSLLIIGTSVAVAAGLWAFFRFTTVGLSYRALAEQPDVARLLGLRTSRLGALTWAMCAVLGLVIGALVAPTAFLTPNMMEPYLLFTFTGVVLGGLTSLPGALVGSVIVGIVSNVTAVAFDPDLAVLVVFGLLLAVLLLRPQGLLGEPEVARL